MKQIIAIILLIACAVSIRAEEKLPFEIERINNSREAKIKEIDRQYKIALMKQKNVYVKRHDMESAKLIDAILVKLADDDTEKEAMKTRARVDCKAKFYPFEPGERYYRDKPKLEIISVPEMFKGYEYTKYATWGVDIAFTVKKAGIVTIVAGHNMEEKGWTVVAKGKRSGYTGEDPVEFAIYQKELPKGEYFFQKAALLQK